MFRVTADKWGLFVLDICMSLLKVDWHFPVLFVGFEAYFFKIYTEAKFVENIQSDEEGNIDWNDVCLEGEERTMWYRDSGDKTSLALVASVSESK